MSYEIHPETPPGGLPLAEYFKGSDLTPMHEMLRRRAAEFDLPFEAPHLLANSRPAILAAEWAREEGAHAALSRRIFAAYFAEGRNIGDLDVLLSQAKEIGLDPVGLSRSLLSEQYADRLAEAEHEARRLGITGVPTFFVTAPGQDPESTPETRRIVGAQPLEVFRGALSGP